MSRGHRPICRCKPTYGCAVDPDFEYSRLSREKTSPRERTYNAKTTDSVYCAPIPFVRVLGFSYLVLVRFLSCFGRRYLRRGGVWVLSGCTVPRSTVPFPMTPPYVGRGVIFLLKLFFTHDSRYAPWLAHTGREYHTALWRPTSCCVTVRLRAGYAPVTFRSKKALVQLAVSNRTLTSVLQLLCFFKSLHCSVTRGDS